MGRSDLSLRAQFRKLWEISFLQRLIFLLTDRIWSHSDDFGRPKQGQQFFKFFLESGVRKDFVGTCPENFSL